MAETDQLQVELVSADRTVWSGQAKMVIARTAEGDIGVLRNHTPVLSLLRRGFTFSFVVDPTEQWMAMPGLDGVDEAQLENRLRRRRVRGSGKNLHCPMAVRNGIAGPGAAVW